MQFWYHGKYGNSTAVSYSQMDYGTIPSSAEGQFNQEAAESEESYKQRLQQEEAAELTRITARLGLIPSKQCLRPVHRPASPEAIYARSMASHWSGAGRDRPHTDSGTRSDTWCRFILDRPEVCPPCPPCPPATHQHSTYNLLADSLVGIAQNRFSGRLSREPGIPQARDKRQARAAFLAIGCRYGRLRGKVVGQAAHAVRVKRGKHDSPVLPGPWQDHERLIQRDRLPVQLQAFLAGISTGQPRLP